MKDMKAIVAVLAPALLVSAMSLSVARGEGMGTGGSVSAIALTAGAAPAVVGEVVVTANKRIENARNVPISIAVISGAEAVDHHIESYEDITRVVPGVSFTAHNGPGQDNISIRGVSSTVGDPTIAVYIDEVPIVTAAGYEGIAQPKLFDLSQVEVLKGPQGTLYGASSEGGTIRFLTNQPDLEQFSGQLTSTLSGTWHGGVNGDQQGVVNLPIIPDRFAVRIAAELTHLSGYIDSYNLNGNLQQRGVNSEDDGVLHVSGKLALDNDLTITPSVFYQLLDSNDSPTFYPDLGLFKQEKQVSEFDRDQMFIPSLTIKKGTSFADFTSITSYFWRHISRQADGTAFNSAAIAEFFLDPDPAHAAFQPQNDSILARVASPVLFTDSFHTVTQEFRLSSPASWTRVKWVGGVFYSDQQWTHYDHETAPGFSADFQNIYGYPITQDPILDPTGNPNLWNKDLVWQVFDNNDVTQYSVFGQIDVDVLPRLHVSLGDRYVYAHETFSELGGGFFDLGGAGTTGTPYRQAASFNTSTPKATVTFNLTPTANIYASAGKGFRLGGATTPNTNAACVTGLNQLGLPNAPTTYGPDQLWSYEFGSKSLLFGKTMSVNADVYDIEWSKIQQTIVIPICGGAFNANVGDARAYGAELELRYRPPLAPGLTLGLNIAGEHATITSTTNAQTAAVGQDILNVPEEQISVLADYNWPISGAVEGFVRADYDWEGKSKGSFQVTDPNYNDPAYGVANLSVGANIGSIKLEAFAKNLANDHTIIQRPQINTVTEGYTVRPLTVGVSATKNF